MARDARYGDLELRAVRKGAVQRKHPSGCDTAAQLYGRKRWNEAMLKNKNLHTEMIIPRVRRRAISVFWVLEFAGIEVSIGKPNGEHIQAPISEYKKNLDQNSKNAGAEDIERDRLGSFSLPYRMNVNLTHPVYVIQVLCIACKGSSRL
jgi:hypothetical protein